MIVVTMLSDYRAPSRSWLPTLRRWEQVALPDDVAGDLVARGLALTGEHEPKRTQLGGGAPQETPWALPEDGDPRTAYFREAV